MMKLDQIISLYEQTIVETKLLLSAVRNKIYRISMLRVFLFMAGIAGVIYLFNFGWMIILLVCLCTFIPFLALVKYHNRLFYRKEYLEKKNEVYENELSAINYNFSAFDNGKEFIDPAHLYSFDLDLFGNNSLFQSINRTVTLFGKNQLREWFIAPMTQKKTIEERQEAIRELSAELKFRQRFRIHGLLYKGEPADREEIETWIKSEHIYLKKKRFQVLLYAVPLTNLTLWGLAIAGIISFNWPGLAFVSFVIASFAFQKNISRIQSMYGKKHKILSTYAQLMKMTEKRQSTSVLLNNIRQKLGEKKSSASFSLQLLTKELNILDQRSNMIISTILDGLLFWQLRQVIRIEAWKKEYANQLLVWLDAIGEMDALNSLATFAYNHPDYCYPTIAMHPFVLKAKQMGHPLMQRDKCVRNDLEIVKRPYFIIITGANMAGKSTYLRTIGVNHLLACTGAPVCCNEMEIYPAKLITSLRTSDSLTDNESYFFAELKRLKLIIDKLNSGEELFIILDEILKGTNSIDKQKGSFALIKQFMNLKADGIIATHDLQLGKLSELYPSDIHNYCFEAEIHQDELVFPYLLKEGVAQNMNACFLMRKMGIVVEE